MKKQVQGFTLSELLLVVAIIGVLLLAALPNQTSVLSKAKSVEAKLQLQQAYALQRSYFFEHSKYAASLSEAGYEQVKTVDIGGMANYLLTMEVFQNGQFLITARAVVDFDNDGKFNEWTIDQDKVLKETVPD